MALAARLSKLCPIAQAATQNCSECCVQASSAEGCMDVALALTTHILQQAENTGVAQFFLARPLTLKHAHLWPPSLHPLPFHEATSVLHLATNPRPLPSLLAHAGLALLIPHSPDRWRVLSPWSPRSGACGGT